MRLLARVEQQAYHAMPAWVTLVVIRSAPSLGSFTCYDYGTGRYRTCGPEDH